MRLITQRCLYALLGCWVLTCPVNGQVPGMPSLSAPSEAPPTAETPEQTETRLELWLKEARLALGPSNEPGAETRVPEGITPANFSDYRRTLEQIVQGVARHQKTLASQPDAIKALEAARTAEAAWTGFSESPPYSVLFIDELVNQHDATKAQASSHRSSLELVERARTTTQEEAKLAEETHRRLLEEVEEQSPNNEAEKWRLTAQKAKSRLLALRATSLQSSASLLNDQVGATQIQRSLLERQIATAKKKASFSDADIAKVKKAAEDRRAAIRKEIAAVRKDQQEAATARAEFQKKLDEILSATPEGDGAAPSAELPMAQLKLEAGDARVDALQSVVETLESLEQLEPYVPEAYENRKILMLSTAAADRENALQSMRANHDRLKAWGVVVGNQLSAVNADISKQESRSTMIAADDPRLVPMNEQRAALWEKQAVIQRLSQAVALQRRTLKRWIGEFDQTTRDQPLAPTFEGTVSKVKNFFRWISAIEIFHYDDTVMAGGIPITERRGVTLGRTFIAIFGFMAAYFIAGRIKSRLQNAVVSRGRIAHAQANTLSNWLMIVVGLLLAVTTLHFLRIPLTVFAFLGGALAIGLGFGSQTLIKNFISGIIVLFERKIRVGDIVDVGGLAGTVTEINTRSSVLRGADGRETLIPNSFFLENRITNLTLSNRRVRRMLTVRIAPGCSPHAVSVILTECAERHGLILQDPVPIITFEDFADNAHVFGIYYWTEFNDKTNCEVVASDLRFMIQKRFLESGIEFPSVARECAGSTDPAVQFERVKKFKPPLQ